MRSEFSNAQPRADSVATSVNPEEDRDWVAFRKHEDRFMKEMSALADGMLQQTFDTLQLPPTADLSFYGPPASYDQTGYCCLTG